MLSLLICETKPYYHTLYLCYSLQEFYILTIQLIYDNTLKSEKRSKCRASLVFFLDVKNTYLKTSLISFFERWNSGCTIKISKHSLFMEGVCLILK